jgi:hypothetical protein
LVSVLCLQKLLILFYIFHNKKTCREKSMNLETFAIKVECNQLLHAGKKFSYRKSMRKLYQQFNNHALDHAGNYLL